MELAALVNAIANSGNEALAELIVNTALQNAGMLANAIAELQPGKLAEFIQAVATSNAGALADAIAALKPESLTNLIETVATSGASKIADAIAALPAEQRQALATALAPVFPEGVAPEATAGERMTTNVMGDRSMLLGKPVSWVSINGKNVPTF